MRTCRIILYRMEYNIGIGKALRIYWHCIHDLYEVL